MSIKNTLTTLVALFVLTSCVPSQPNSETLTSSTLQPTSTSTSAPGYSPDTFVYKDTNFGDLYHLPNLWTKITPSKITIYPYDWIYDYAYAADGSLWVTGGFGILHKDTSGKQTLYSIKNGLPNNTFTVIAISPKGEVWAGGPENLLLRFDGENWIDEGDKLPPPFDERNNWLCYSHTISGIDFGPDGSAWVINNGIEIYHQVDGGWVNFPFPKEILPIAGGGACPLGIRVKSEKDITIMLNSNGFMNPSGIHFDGQSWNATDDYSAVDDQLTTRHHGMTNYDYIINFPLAKLPIDPGTLLTGLHYPPVDQYSSPYLLALDEKGRIWINSEYSDLDVNEAGTFIDLYYPYYPPGKDVIESSELYHHLLNFGTEVFIPDPERAYKSINSLLPKNNSIYYTKDHPFYFANDSQGKIWFYVPELGLMQTDGQSIKNISKIPTNLFDGISGGVLPMRDGRVWVGGAGVIYEYQVDQWGRIPIQSEDQLFTYFVEDSQGTVYAATGEGVYQFDNGNYDKEIFTPQGYKPIVITDASESYIDIFYKHYISAQNFTVQVPSSDTYTARYLGIQPDGSIIYINNRVVAKLKDGIWKSFLFDTMSIDSALVDDVGNIWLSTHADGLLKLSPDIFDDYQPLNYH